MSLFARVGATVAAAVADKMTRCERHGYQSTIDACPCVLAEGIAYFVSSTLVVCAVHHAELKAEDQGIADRAAAACEPTCARCVADVVAQADPWDAAMGEIDAFRKVMFGQ